MTEFCCKNFIPKIWNGRSNNTLGIRFTQYFLCTPPGGKFPFLTLESYLHSAEIFSFTFKRNLSTQLTPLIFSRAEQKESKKVEKAAKAPETEANGDAKAAKNGDSKKEKKEEPKKEFACNGTVVDHSEYGEVLQLQGDQRENICKLLVTCGLVKQDQLKVHGF